MGHKGQEASVCPWFIYSFDCDLKVWLKGNLLFPLCLRHLLLRVTTVVMFQIEVEEDIGKLFKVRLGFHGEENYPEWYTDLEDTPSWYLEKVSHVT